MDISIKPVTKPVTQSIVDESPLRQAGLLLETIETQVKKHASESLRHSMQSGDSCASYPYETCPHCGGAAMRDELEAQIAELRAKLTRRGTGAGRKLEGEPKPSTLSSRATRERIAQGLPRLRAPKVRRNAPPPPNPAPSSETDAKGAGDCTLSEGEK